MINRDELLKMVRDAHGPITGQWFDMDIASLDRLKDAILERAAVECEKLRESKEPISSRNDGRVSDMAFGGVVAVDECATSIRALKNTRRIKCN